MSHESIEELKAILEKQDERMEHLIWQVVGNEKLGIEGLKPSMKRIEKDVHEMKMWRDGMWKVDLKRFMTKEVVNGATKFFIYGVFGGGGALGIIKLIKLIFKQ